ncbi:MAG: SGNH/GDSL hydrolase family protein [Leptolyngbya sp. SIO4C1]|nr:SGNH/GDSL hydrolase family protein [Leptolyngbya sp. SIO4C1]
MAVKIVWIGLAIALCGLLLTELLLRLLGFGCPPLYQADSDIGYLLAPNQRLRRFGNRIEINQYSLRTAPISAQRPSQTLRILLIGDSIVNGNWWTDQAETLSAQLEQSLESPADYQQVEVLNASANSWGPRNELAYLKRFGTFEAQVVVLVLNTDDLFGTKPTSLQVGRDRSYPDRRPASALSEVAERYLRRPAPVPGLKEIQAEPGDRVGFNLEAVKAIEQLVTANQAQLILAMTPLKREVLPSGPRDYELAARSRLETLAQTLDLPYLSFLTAFQQAESPAALYRDHIHLSPQGNQLVCEQIRAAIQALDL